MSHQYRLGIIGHPLGHTLSPVMHTAAGNSLGLDLAYYAYDVPPDSLGDFMAELRGKGLDGLNVTVPHKTEVIRWLDEVSEEAAMIGAVNTIIIRDGRLSGYNTDAYGFAESLTQNAGADPAGKAALVLGAGGACRAVVWALARGGARVTLANRTRERAEAVAEDFKKAGMDVAVAPFHPDSLAAAMAEAQIVVNATSVGMKGAGAGALAEVEKLLRPGHLAVDIVYRPLSTPFLTAARKAGCSTLDGLWMLIHQGARSFEMWTGRKFPVALARERLLAELGEGGAG